MSLRDLGEVITAAVRAERARRKWTQADLAERCRWAVSTVGDTETGRRRLLLDDLPVLCQAFGLPLTELLRAADRDDLSALGLRVTYPDE